MCINKKRIFAIFALKIEKVMRKNEEIFHFSDDVEKLKIYFRTFVFRADKNIHENLLIRS